MAKGVIAVAGYWALFIFQAEAGDLGELCVSLCFRPISGRLIVTITKIRGLPKVAADRTGMWAILLCLIVRLCFIIKKEKWTITWEHTRKFRDWFSRKIAKRFKRKNETAYAFHRTFNDSVSMFAAVIRAFAFQQFIPGSILRLVVGRVKNIVHSLSCCARILPL